jgi:hypothetical protein
MLHAGDATHRLDLRRIATRILLRMFPFLYRLCPDVMGGLRVLSPFPHCIRNIKAMLQLLIVRLTWGCRKACIVRVLFRWATDNTGGTREHWRIFPKHHTPLGSS